MPSRRFVIWSEWSFLLPTCGAGFAIDFVELPDSAERFEYLKGVVVAVCGPRSMVSSKAEPKREEKCEKPEQ